MINPVNKLVLKNVNLSIHWICTVIYDQSYNMYKLGVHKNLIWIFIPKYKINILRSLPHCLWNHIYSLIIQTYMSNKVKWNPLSLYLSPPWEIVVHDLTGHVSEHFVGERLLSTQEQSVQRVVQLELVLGTYLIPDPGQDASSVGLGGKGWGQKGGHHLSIQLHDWKDKKTLSFVP